MKVAIIISEFNTRGGTTKQVHRLVEYLLNQKHYVEIITELYEKEKCYSGSENFIIKSFENFSFSKQSSRISKLIGLYKIANYIVKNFDCINVHDNGNYVLKYFIKLKKPSIPIVWQINDLPMEFKQANLAYLSSKWFFPIKRRFIKFVAGKIDLVTVNVTKNKYLVQKFLGKPAEVLYCGVDLRFNNYKAKPPIDKIINLISTGIFFPYRNYETLLKVQEHLTLKEYKVKVDIIGAKMDTNYASKIESIIKEKKLNCILHGDVCETKLNYLYSQADIFLFINIDQSWGLSIFEAMNFGLPTIISNSVGAIELLQDSKNTFMVDPVDFKQIADKIILLINDVSIKDKISKNAYDITSTMTWDNMYCSKLESILNRLIGC